MEKLGVILINGSVTITDPCYEPRIWCAAVMNVLPGQWVCQGEKVYDKYVKTLRIYKPGYEGVIPNEYYCSVSVDSGQCGFFDTAYYEKKQPDETWYKEVCEITLNKYFGLTPDSYGVVSSSVYGDGVYPVYVGREAHDEIVAIELRFIA